MSASGGQMDAQQQPADAQANALFRLHRRAYMMHQEACSRLFDCAVQSGDVAARQLAMNVVTALKMLADYTNKQLFEGET